MMKMVKIIFVLLAAASLLGVGLTVYTQGKMHIMVKPERDYYSFQSYNYPRHYIRHKNFLGEITTISTESDRKDATLLIVPGLADDRYISFASINYPSYYLRHQDFRIKLHERTDDDLFKKDATFIKVPGLADSSWVSFASYNYPGYYIRHRDFHLYLEKGDSDLFRKDVTFKIVEPLYIIPIYQE